MFLVKKCCPCRSNNRSSIFIEISANLLSLALSAKEENSENKCLLAVNTPPADIWNPGQPPAGLFSVPFDRGLTRSGRYSHPSVNGRTSLELNYKPRKPIHAPATVVLGLPCHRQSIAVLSVRTIRTVNRKIAAQGLNPYRYSEIYFVLGQHSGVGHDHNLDYSGLSASVLCCPRSDTSSLPASMAILMLSASQGQSLTRAP